jgi:hypothetical protein
MSRKQTVLKQIEIYVQLVKQQEELISTYEKLKAMRNSNDFDTRIFAINQQIANNKKTIDRYYRELKQFE